MGQYFDEESNLSYNYFRSYQPTQGRFTQPDPIGLDGGWSRFGYANQNALMYTDPLGLWSVTFGGYAGPGGQITFGNDNGNGFVTARVGFGAGGGITYNPNGGIPGGPPSNPSQGGVAMACTAKASFNAGPLQSSLEGGVSRNFNDGNSSLITSPASNGRFSNGWLGGGFTFGPNVNANVGGQITVYGGRR